jgi:hypothetical protein
MEQFKDKFSNFGIIWKYKNGVWSAFSQNEDINQKLPTSKIEKISLLSKNEGFWIYNNEMEQISFNGEAYKTAVSNNKGWQLLGTGDDLNISTIYQDNNNINVMWVYKNGKWSANSPDEVKQKIILDSKLIDTFNKIDSGSGFWVNVE